MEYRYKWSIIFLVREIPNILLRSWQLRLVKNLFLLLMKLLQIKMSARLSKLHFIFGLCHKLSKNIYQWLLGKRRWINFYSNLWRIFRNRRFSHWEVDKSSTIKSIRTTNKNKLYYFSWNGRWKNDKSKLKKADESLLKIIDDFEIGFLKNEKIKIVIHQENIQEEKLTKDLIEKYIVSIVVRGNEIL